MWKRPLWLPDSTHLEGQSCPVWRAPENLEAEADGGCSSTAEPRAAGSCVTSTTQNFQVPRWDSALRQHLMLPELGLQPQMCLVIGCLIVIGCCGLSCPLLNTWQQPVEAIGLVDYDMLESSKLVLSVYIAWHRSARPGSALPHLTTCSVLPRVHAPHFCT